LTSGFGYPFATGYLTSFVEGLPYKLKMTPRQVKMLIAELESSRVYAMSVELKNLREDAAKSKEIV
jgi:hypothetical protein